MIKKKIAVTTWNGGTVKLPKGKTPLWHLIGPYYLARVGYNSLLNLDYYIYFERLSGFRGRSGSGKRIVYSLLKKPYASNIVRLKAHSGKRGIHSMKHGVLSTLTRKMSLKILLRQIPKQGAINLPLHRYDYQLVAVCLYGSNGKILDIDYRCRDTPF